MSGADWMLGDVGKKPATNGAAKKKLLDPNGEVVTPEELDAALRALPKEANRAAHSVRQLKGIVEELKSAGLTGDALCVLVQMKTPWINGRVVPLGTVEAVLKGLLRIGEHAP